MSHKPDPDKNVNLTINGMSVTVPEGTRILEAAKKVNVDIPTLCEHPDLCRRGICRICVVECDGRGKLLTACTNDVWEGVNVVTHNARLLDVRKTILELILADHPQDCLSCIRNKNCELQALSESFAIRGNPFDRDFAVQLPEQLREHSSAISPKTVENKTLIREMEKCIKCCRCSEVCQEVQTIRAINTSCRSHNFGISVPYRHTLDESTCVFCGKCASVCPVGAIYGYDQSAEVMEILGKSDRHVIAQVSEETVTALSSLLCGQKNNSADNCCTDCIITAGKITAALKQIGFKKVYDAQAAANVSYSELKNELEKRKKNGGKLPMISGSWEGISRFIKNFYPELEAHLAAGKNKRRTFADAFKYAYIEEEKVYISNVITVSFVPTVAGKFGDYGKNDYALTASELARLIKSAGIDICCLAEEKFDNIKTDTSNQNSYTKPEIINGFPTARKVLESVLKSECISNWIEI